MMRWLHRLILRTFTKLPSWQNCWNTNSHSQLLQHCSVIISQNGQSDNKNRSMLNMAILPWWHKFYWCARGVKNVKMTKCHGCRKREGNRTSHGSTGRDGHIIFELRYKTSSSDFQKLASASENIQKRGSGEGLWRGRVNTDRGEEPRADVGRPGPEREKPSDNASGLMFRACCWKTGPRLKSLWHTDVRRG